MRFGCGFVTRSSLRSPCSGHSLFARGQGWGKPREPQGCPEIAKEAGVAQESAMVALRLRGCEQVLASLALLRPLAFRSRQGSGRPREPQGCPEMANDAGVA